MSGEPSVERIMDVARGFWASKTLLTAVELGLFTELAREPGDSASLERRLELPNHRAAIDFLDALTALGFLERTHGVYRNAPDAERYLDRAKPSYIGGALEMFSSRLYPIWAKLREGLESGKAQNVEAQDRRGAFLAMYEDPVRLDVFMRSMTGLSWAANAEIARRFPWRDYTTFADLGTAQGGLAVQIALANPHLTGIGWDLPPVRTIFEAYARENGVGERLKFQGGDFFEGPLPKVDVITLGHILHNWNAEKKELLLQKAYEALPPGGSCIVYEALIDDDRSKNAVGLLMSLNMLLTLDGAFDFTGAECVAWMKKVGFREARLEHLVGPDSMVVGIK